MWDFRSHNCTYKREHGARHLNLEKQGTGVLGRYARGGSTLGFKDEPRFLVARERLAQSQSRLSTKSLSSPLGELPRKQGSTTFWRRGCGPCDGAEDKEKWSLDVSSILRVSSCWDLRILWKALLLPS